MTFSDRIRTLSIKIKVFNKLQQTYLKHNKFFLLKLISYIFIDFKNSIQLNATNSIRVKFGIHLKYL